MVEQEFDVAMLGCGIMGSAMARTAQRKGLRVIAWDRSLESARSVGEGVTAVGDLQTAASKAHVVVTMLPDADAVLEVMDQQHGLDAVKPGCAWVQMATIGLNGIQRAQQLANRRPGVLFVDAPVSGSKGPAQEGRLIILASTDASDLPPRVTKLFEALGQRTMQLGKTGQGTRMKLVLNAWLSQLMEGLAETLAAADSLGISAQQLRDCLEGGPMGPPLVIAKLQKIDAGATGETEFPLKWADKDVHLAIEAVKSTRQRSLPVLETIARVWDRALQQGLGDRDVSAAYLAVVS